MNLDKKNTYMFLLLFVVGSGNLVGPCHTLSVFLNLVSPRRTTTMYAPRASRHPPRLLLSLQTMSLGDLTLGITIVASSLSSNFFL
jgi:hypothetical protein